MEKPSDEKLDRLLRQAYPPVEVSPDFTLRLWRKLMKGAGRPPWMVPVPVAAIAAAVGLLAGLWSWPYLLPEGSQSAAVLRQADRLDLFGNAPLDSVAGTYLNLVKGDRG